MKEIGKCFRNSREISSWSLKITFRYQAFQGRLISKIRLLSGDYKAGQIRKSLTTLL